MKITGNNTVKLNSALSVLIVSGLTGFCLGVLHAKWQVTVETGQVLAGIVKYPLDNPNYMYHIKLFTIINHFSALLLYLTGSEKIVSIIISGFLGMVSFQALSTFIFAINRDGYISILGTALIYIGNFVGSGVIYPVWLLGQPHTYGILGLSFIILVIALIGSESYRSGFFCLGLAPAVHPSLGSWLFLIALISFFFQMDYAKKVIRKYYRYFAAGMFIAVSSLIYQLHLMQALPVIDPEVKKQYLYNFIKYWDYHRQKFYWDYTTEQIHFFKPGIIICICSIVLGSISLVCLKNKDSVCFIFRFIIISGILSLLLAVLTHLPPEVVPEYLLIFMPGRYINLNNMVFASSLIGMLTCWENKHFRLVCCVILFLSFGFSPSRIQKWGASFSIISVLIWFAYLTFIKKTSSVHVHYAGLLKSFLCVTATLLLIIPSIGLFKHYMSDIKDRTNDNFYSGISERKGLLLTTSDSFMVPIKTRRPILVEAASIDGFNMVPESGNVLNNILKKVYGLDLLIPLPEDIPYPRGGNIPAKLHKRLWEKRTIEEWQEIRKEFGVTDILTKTGWNLLLPVVAEENEKILYEIPIKG